VSKLRPDDVNDPGGGPVAVPTNTSWLVCAASGCAGIKLLSGSLCLAHAEDMDRAAALNEVHETGAIDARGVQISDELLAEVLAAAPRARNGKALFRHARFDHATFTSVAVFHGAAFTSGTVFSGATFTGGAEFSGATFSGGAVFGGANFLGDARFGGAAITGDAAFSAATFSGDAVFGGARFAGNARFSRASVAGQAKFGGVNFAGSALFGEVTFAEQARFDRATFTGHARFDQATFSGDTRFDEATFARDADFNRASFTGDTRFDQAVFSGEARFDRAAITGDADFDRARFSRNVRFDGATFTSSARFVKAAFGGEAAFGDVVFTEDARFNRAVFSDSTRFNRATFTGSARFDEVTFNGRTRFDRVTFSDDAAFYKASFRRLAIFAGAKFEHAHQFGPLLAYRGLVLDGAEFTQAVQIEISSIGICCRGARFPGGVQFRLRWARVVLDEAEFPAPSILKGIPQLSSEELAQQEEPMVQAWRRLLGDNISEQPQLLSLMRANVVGLGLSNVTVADCRFADAHNLDKMRIEADVSFAAAPTVLGRLNRKGRQVIAEERDWRAGRPHQWGWRAPRWPDWLGNRPGGLEAGQIADRYRALRKGREDTKNEPGAAYFYYGEMEMRRHSRTSPAAERGIIWLYWLISGYGLRSLRSLTALVILGIVVTIALTSWGLGATAPATTPPQQMVGTVSTASRQHAQIKATLSGITPRLPAANQRWTKDRAETALEVTFESFVFRSTDEPLTTAGTWITIAARIIGPVLLALALLAVRNRVRR
jgi:uncharacterized protein YjbI with pentapeptide repeats